VSTTNPIRDRGRTLGEHNRPPYRLTAALLIGSMIVCQAIPWSQQAIAGNVPPLLAQLHPSAGPWLPVAIVALAVMLLVLPRSLDWPRWAFLATAVGVGFVVSVSLAAEAHGWSAVTAPFQRSLEYYASVPLVRELGPRAFAERFPDLGAQLSLHAATHGPNAVLFLWVLWKLTGGSLLGVSLLVALVGVAGVLPTYGIARELTDERGARLAALLFLCAPGALIYSATSMDAVFMTVVACGLAALVRFPRSGVWAIVAGALWALAFSFTFGSFVLGLFAAGLCVVTVRERRSSIAVLAGRAVLIIAGLVLGLALLRFTEGANLIADFRAASRAHYHDPSRARPYLFWVVANIPAFLWVAGVVQSALFAFQTRHRWHARAFGFETVLVGVLAVSTVSGVFLGEVDHIWLFFIPPLVVVAGQGLETTLQERRGSLRMVLGGALVQTLLIQLLLYTYW
jgi:methylthioxylose transferase